MPLTKLKELLGDNYSRVLSNTDSRFVVTHDALDLGPYDSKQQLYWLWPFESPPNVKSFIRRELQDHSTVQPSLFQHRTKHAEYLGMTISYCLTNQCIPWIDAKSCSTTFCLKSGAGFVEARCRLPVLWVVCMNVMWQL